MVILPAPHRAAVEPVKPMTRNVKPSLIMSNERA